MRRAIHTVGSLAACVGGSAVLLTATPAFASGGEHTVDDSEVEAAGLCHLEVWGTQAAHRLSLSNFGPSCTPKHVPWLEAGGALQTFSFGGGVHDTQVGPALKATLKPAASGWGLGATLDSLSSTRNGRLQAANLLGVLTVPVSQKVRVNLTAGAAWAVTDRRTQPFAGAQVEVALSNDLSVMVETYRRRGEDLGGQVGLRWTPRQGRVDYDLVLGRRVDGFSDTALSIGVTFRS